jgi:hypothetical protein
MGNGVDKVACILLNIGGIEMSLCGWNTLAI